MIPFPFAQFLKPTNGIGQFHIATFETREAARNAIRISRLWMQLRKARGEIYNDDFLPANAKNIRIVPLSSEARS